MKTFALMAELAHLREHPSFLLPVPHTGGRGEKGRERKRKKERRQRREERRKRREGRRKMGEDRRKIRKWVQLLWMEE